MFNLITLMVSKKSKTSSKESQNKKFSFNFFSIIFSSKKLRALALVTILGMSVIVTSGCKQDPPITQDSEETNPDNPTQEPTDEDPTEPPQDSEETNPDNPTQEPTDENPIKPSIDLENTKIVKGIKKLGFGIDIVDVEPVEGLYTPETGDLIDLKFTDYDVDIWIHMQLDREKSTKDNLVYKCVKAWDSLYDEDIDAQDLHDRYFDKMTFDKENHSVSFFYTDDANIEKRLMTTRIELDECGEPSFIYNGIGNDYKDHAQEVDNGEVFEPPGITQYDEIEIILAK